MKYQFYHVGGRVYADGSGEGINNLDNTLQIINRRGEVIVSVTETNGSLIIITGESRHG